jgi:hypothetical protein
MASVDSLMTGVPVTPSGSILSHGSDDWATGVLSDRFHISLPVPASRGSSPTACFGFQKQGLEARASLAF